MSRAAGYRLGVLGGSFNPIHNAHLHIGREALSAFALREVWFLPTGNPPHKRVGLANKTDRLRMVELAVAGQPGLAACDLEVHREGVTYTVETLREMKRLYPRARVWYIIGADTLLELHTWREPEAVFKLCSFIVCARPGWQEEAVRACTKKLRAAGARLHFLRAPGLAISSTMVRECLRRGERPDGLVPPSVAQYLWQNRLYMEDPAGEPPPSPN